MTLEVGTPVTWRDKGTRGRIYRGTITHGCGDLFQAIITHSSEQDAHDIGWHRNFPVECLLPADAFPSPKETMTTALIAGAPPAKHSAPNTAGAKAAAPDKKAWSAEIHTPVAEYNANLPMADIVPDPENRKDHDPAKLRSLADQIKAEGLIQPIVVRPHTNGRFMIIAGERRFMAHKLLERLTIRAFIHKGETELTATTKQILENVGRLDLDPIEEARQFKRLEQLGMKQADIGKLAGGKSQSTIANTLKLLQLPPAVQQMVAAGKLTAAHGQELVRFAAWPKVCARIADMTHTHDYDAKSLRDDKLPFGGTLEQDGLVERINLDRGYTWETRPVYKLPAALADSPAFINDHGQCYYVLPADAEDNVWAPEKAKQDAARAAKEKAAKKPAADGKKTPEQKARAKKIADNKAARNKVDAGLQAVVDRLKKTKGIDSAALILVAHCASVHGDSNADAAELLGVKLPAKFAGHRESWAEMDPADVIRILAVAIVMKKAREAKRFAGSVPAEIEALQKKSTKKS